VRHDGGERSLEVVGARPSSLHLIENLQSGALSFSDATGDHPVAFTTFGQGKQAGVGTSQEQSLLPSPLSEKMGSSAFLSTLLLRKESSLPW